MSGEAATNVNAEVVEECEIVLHYFLQAFDETTKDGTSENDREIIRYGCEKLGIPSGSPGERVYKVFLLGLYAGLRLPRDIADNSGANDTDVAV